MSAAGETHGIAHAEEADHLAGQGGGVFEIVFGAGGDFVEDDFFGGALARRPGFARLKDFGPSLDVEDTNKEIVVTAELPGLDEKDFEVTLAGDVLTIKGEKKTETEGRNGGHYVERRFGSFSRSVRLPFAASDDQVKAKYEKGVLTIRLAKPADAQNQVKRIKISTA